MAAELGDIKLSLEDFKRITGKGENSLYSHMAVHGVRKDDIDASYALAYVSRMNPKQARGPAIGRLAEYVRQNGGELPTERKNNVEPRAEIGNNGDGDLDSFQGNIVDFQPTLDRNGRLKYKAFASYDWEQIGNISGLSTNNADLVRRRVQRKKLQYPVPGYVIARILVDKGDLLPLYSLGYPRDEWLPQIREQVEAEEAAYKMIKARKDGTQKK